MRAATKNQRESYTLYTSRSPLAWRPDWRRGARVDAGVSVGLIQNGVDRRNRADFRATGNAAALPVPTLKEGRRDMRKIFLVFTT